MADSGKRPPPPQGFAAIADYADCTAARTARVQIASHIESEDSVHALHLRCFPPSIACGGSTFLNSRGFSSRQDRNRRTAGNLCRGP